MFNMKGEVVGIVSHNISKSGGLGFVVTINTAKKLLLGRPSFWSGLEGRLISGPIAQILNLPQPSGYLVKTVAKGSAGDAVGPRSDNAPRSADGADREGGLDPDHRRDASIGRGLRPGKVARLSPGQRTERTGRRV